MKIWNKIKELVAKKLPGYNIGDIMPVVIAFGLIAIIGGVVLLILQNFAIQGSVASCSNGGFVYPNGACTNGGTNTLILTAAYNGITYGVSGINQIMSFLPLIALVVVAAVVIGTVVGAFVLGGGGAKEF